MTPATEDFRTHLIDAWPVMQPVALRIVDAVHDLADHQSAAAFLDALAAAAHEYGASIMIGWPGMPVGVRVLAADVADCIAHEEWQ